MILWKVFLTLGFILLILELIMPTTFFLSLAIGSFATGILAIFVHTYNILVPVFVVVSIASLLLFRPFLRDNIKSKEESGVEEKYIGKTAKVTEKVTKDVTNKVTKEVTEKNTLDIAKKLKESGVSIEIIESTTGLSKEKIELL